jgi:hypothetical protein
MNDQAIEQEIQAKGKTAPRVAPADIEANIVGEYYFTAAEGTLGATLLQECLSSGNVRVTSKDLGDQAEKRPMDLLTFCVLVLRNGFTVTGESACASPENFDAQIGRKIARQNAVQKIWPLMGYQLREELHRQATNEQQWQQAYNDPRLMQHIDMVRESGWTPVETITKATVPPAILPSALRPHQQRVVDEKRELDERLQKLMTFTCTPTFAALPGPERNRLAHQADTMAKYSEILGDCIAAFAPDAD